MAEYIISNMKHKNEDGSYSILYPINSIESVVIDPATGVKLSDKLTNAGNNYSGTAAMAESVPWSGVKGTPTTIDGYGITDVLKTTDVVSTATPNKILRLDANAKLPATIFSGVIPIENLPHGAIERCVVVADDNARFALTTDEVQTGDTVKVTSSNKMYFVVDSTKLSSEEGYEVYTAGSATNVPWSGITGKPTTLSGYAITDAVNNSEVATTATANKLLKLNSDKKLPADITGNAATATNVAWSGITDKPTTLSGFGITDAVNSSEVVTTATANKLLKLNSAGQLPASITGNAATASKLSAEKTISLTGDVTGSGKFDGSGDLSITATIKDDSHNHIISNVDGLQDALNAKAPLASPALTGTPTAPTATAGTNTTQIATTAFVKTALDAAVPNISGAGSSIISNNLTTNRALISNGSGKVAVSDVTSTELSYLDGVTSSIQTQLNSRVLTSDVVTAATANKLLKLNSDKKLPADITGNAATATNVAWSGITDKPTTLSGFGITDGVNSSDVVTTPVANKILKLNSSAQIPISAIPQTIEFVTFTSADIS